MDNPSGASSNRNEKILGISSKSLHDAIWGKNLNQKSRPPKNLRAPLPVLRNDPLSGSNSNRHRSEIGRRQSSILRRRSRERSCGRSQRLRHSPSRGRHSISRNLSPHAGFRSRLLSSPRRSYLVGHDDVRRPPRGRQSTNSNSRPHAGSGNRLSSNPKRSHLKDLEEVRRSPKRRRSVSTNLSPRNSPLVDLGDLRRSPSRRRSVSRNLSPHSGFDNRLSSSPRRSHLVDLEESRRSPKGRRSVSRNRSPHSGFDNRLSSSPRSSLVDQEDVRPPSRGRRSVSRNQSPHPGYSRHLSSSPRRSFLGEHEDVRHINVETVSHGRPLNDLNRFYEPDLRHFVGNGTEDSFLHMARTSPSSQVVENNIMPRSEDHMQSLTLHEARRRQEWERMSHGRPLNDLNSFYEPDLRHFVGNETEDSFLHMARTSPSSQVVENNIMPRSEDPMQSLTLIEARRRQEWERMQCSLRQFDQLHVPVCRKSPVNNRRNVFGQFDREPHVEGVEIDERLSRRPSISPPPMRDDSYKNRTISRRSPMNDRRNIVGQFDRAHHIRGMEVGKRLSPPRMRGGSYEKEAAILPERPQPARYVHSASKSPPSMNQCSRPFTPPRFASGASNYGQELPRPPHEIITDKRRLRMDRDRSHSVSPSREKGSQKLKKIHTDDLYLRSNKIEPRPFIDLTENKEFRRNNQVAAREDIGTPRWMSQEASSEFHPRFPPIRSHSGHGIERGAGCRADANPSIGNWLGVQLSHATMLNPAYSTEGLTAMPHGIAFSDSALLQPISSGLHPLHAESLPVFGSAGIQGYDNLPLYPGPSVSAMFYPETVTNATRILDPRNFLPASNCDLTHRLVPLPSANQPFHSAMRQPPLKAEDEKNQDLYKHDVDLRQPIASNNGVKNTTINPEICKPSYLHLVLYRSEYPKRVFSKAMQRKILTAIQSAATVTPGIRIINMHERQGCLNWVCEDQKTKDWIISKLKDLECLEGIPWKMGDRPDIKLMHKVRVYLQKGCKPNTDKFLRRLQLQSQLPTTNWVVVNRASDHNFVSFVFKIDDESLEMLQRVNMSPLYNGRKITFKLTKKSDL